MSDESCFRARTSSGACAWRASGPHGGRTGATRAVVLDIFAPPREEYRKAGKGLGVEAV
jgi:hypothetical protein